MRKRALAACLVVFGALIAPSITATHLPIVLWHGMGDSCCDPQSMGKIQATLEATLPGVYVVSIRIGTSDQADRQASFFGNINDQVADVCAQLASDSKLQQGFNAIGFSQGGQMLRAYVQRCNSPPVHRLITFGSQHGGVSDLPHCEDRSDFLCRSMRSIAAKGVYTTAVQSRIVQAQYFKDPHHLDVYTAHSLFLADINNEKQEKSADYARRMASLDRFVMVLFDQDTMVVPKETAWFWTREQDQLLPLVNQTMYTEDWIGMRTLDRAGKLVFLRVPGEHMQLSLDAFRDIVEQYCTSGEPSSEMDLSLLIQA